MKKFRQFTKERKFKLSAHALKHGVATHFSHGEDSRLSDHEMKHGVATHFSHSENRKKKKTLNENYGGLYTKYDAIKKHADEHKPNSHLAVPDNKLNPYLPEGIYREAAKVSQRVAADHPYEDVPHKKEVKKYTENSGPLNRCLYESHVRGDSEPSVPLNHNLGHLDAAVGHHKLKHDLIVYSGVTPRVPNDAAMHPDRKVYHPGFISTSLNPRIAVDFAKPDNDGNHHIVKLHLKAGQPALPVLRHSEHVNETEVIVPRGHTLKLHDKPEIHECDGQMPGGDWSKKEKLYIWAAHIHHDEDGKEKE